MSRDHHRYNTSEKGRTRYRRYRESPHGRTVIATYEWLRYKRNLGARIGTKTERLGELEIELAQILLMASALGSAALRSDHNAAPPGEL
jgi:hypothetical protein